ncbi:MAG TPA: hypothetical protein VF895_06740 [Gaiellaceae bacterium]
MRAATVLGRPRPLPGRLVPAIAGTFVIVLALPVYLIAGWRIGGWGLAAVLWVASQTFSFLLSYLRLGVDNLGSSGLVAFGMMFRGIAVMVVIVAVAVSDSHLALSAAVLYALAYTCELGVSIVSYYSGPAK